jgi:hypothetical protein
MLSLRTLAVAFSLTLLSATAMALPAPVAAPCHSESVHSMGETHEQAAGLARKLVKNTSVGTFMSVMNSSQKSAVTGTFLASFLKGMVKAFLGVGKHKRIDYLFVSITM